MVGFKFQTAEKHDYKITDVKPQQQTQIYTRSLIPFKYLQLQPRPLSVNGTVTESVFKMQLPQSPAYISVIYFQIYNTKIDLLHNLLNYNVKEETESTKSRLAGECCWQHFRLLCAIYMSKSTSQILYM